MRGVPCSIAVYIGQDPKICAKFLESPIIVAIYNVMLDAGFWILDEIRNSFFRVRHSEWTECRTLYTIPTGSGLYGDEYDKETFFRFGKAQAEISGR